MKDSIIKGIPYALDEDGKKTFAKYAKSQITYFCPFCNCKVFHKSNHNGTHFFARYPGEKHIDKRCETIERTGKYHSFQGYSPEAIISGLCRVAPSRTLPPGKQIQTHKPTTPPLQLEDDQLKPIKFTSLKQIFEMGTTDKEPFEPIGNHVMSDYYIHFKWMQQIFSATGFRLGARILQVGVVTAIPSQQIFIFRAYEANIINVRFSLKASNSKVYKDIEKKLFTNVIDPITSKCKKVMKTSQALIASDHWELISKSQCNSLCNSNVYCTSCHGMYFAIAVTAKQVYPIPC